MLRSYHQSTGLAVFYGPSPIAPDAPRGGGRLNDFLSGLTLEWIADGGYWNAGVPMSMPFWQAQEWYVDGPGREIVIKDQDLKIVHETLVDSVTLSAGSLSAQTGSILDSANRFSITYAPILSTSGAIVVGSQTSTVIAENFDSQRRYGIVEKVAPSKPGRVTPAEAERQRDATLRELAWPKADEALNITDSSQVVTVTLNCVGKVKWFNAYVYENTGTGTVFLSDKIVSVIQADPNRLFSADFSRIEQNNFAVQQQEDDNAFAWTILQNLVATGDDATDRRATLGVYRGGRIEYETVPDEPAYQHRLTERGQRIERYGTRQLVQPWEVRPGQRIFFPDFLVGHAPRNVDPARDDRNMLIESVTYTAPYGVSLKGAADSRLAQLLAKKGMWG